VRRLGAAIGIAVFDDVIEAGDQRGWDWHQTYLSPPQRRVLRQFKWAW
jgi:hypothetical protein